MAALAPESLPSAARRILGQDLPQEAERLLREAASCPHRSDEAGDLVALAAEAAPGHAATLIARYRLLFYRGLLRDARAVAEECLALALAEGGHPDDWRRLEPDGRDLSRPDSVQSRFLLFSLKGWAYLSMRLGELDAAREALGVLARLDPGDRMGSRVLSEVLVRGGHDEEDD